MNVFRTLLQGITAILIVFSVASCTAVEKPPLQDQIMDVISNVDGDMAVVFLGLQDSTGNVLINENERFHAASTMKTPVMIEAFKQAEEGKFSLEDSILVKNEFISIVDGSPFSLSIDRDWGDALYDKLGTKVPLREVMHDMITRSGNLATNLMIDLVGAENANRTMHELGAVNIQVLRGVEDMKAFDQGLNNETTAMDLAIIYREIARKSVVSEQACNEMIGILKDQYYNDIIPAGLPEEVEVAHKTGSITGVNHDSGIVYLPDGRSYVLVILSKNLANNSDGRDAGAEISRIIYEHYNSRTM
ncbi:MAG: serine hydrolase [Cyclonatronaceae bacterium]